MISRLKGTIEKSIPGKVIIDVQGVGYDVSMPINDWEKVTQGAEETVEISTYVREDRFSLFGFRDSGGRALFEKLIDMSGIGPRTALEICAVSRDLLLAAISKQDAGLLTSIKGIGKKTAEKLLLDLKNLCENQPDLLGKTKGDTHSGSYDQDVIDALSTLGYNTPTILRALKELPADLATTEDRVAAALRSL
jgi:holliday junction DNA helicase RuvA